MRFSRLPYTLLAAAFILTLQQWASAQTIYSVSSLTYNSSTNMVQGYSATEPDYYTAPYYQVYVRGYIYNQDPNTRLSSQEGPSGYTGAASVSTQTTASPGTLYNLRTENYFDPLYPTCTYFGSCAKDDYYGFYLESPYYTHITDYGATNTWTAPGTYVSMIEQWVWLGNTNTSLISPPSITNPRVSGNLRGMTENALVGADVSLQASSNTTGGTYSWSFTGSPTVVSGAMNQASVAVRWTQTGTFTATVTYTVGTVSASSSVTVAVIIPTLTSFTATEASDQVNRDQGCSSQPAGVTYTLGCYQGGYTEDGIIWNAVAQIPSGQYLTDPDQGGIKFVQGVSVYRKRIRDGNIECWSARNNDDQAQVASGWQLDTDDPYSTGLNAAYTRFSAGNTLSKGDFDAPGSRIEGLTNNVFFSYDTFLADDRFETYVFYFTDTDAGDVIFQRALSLQGSTSPISRLAWQWGGQVTFSYFAQPQKFARQFTSTQTGTVNATGTNTVVSLTSNVKNDVWHTCYGTPATSNPIDGSRFFVTQHYLDFLLRDPSQTQNDMNGVDFWRTNITQCAFDTNCIAYYRRQTSRAFWDSGDFQNRSDVQASGLLTGNSSQPYDYHQFVRWCYKIYLQREPDQSGWSYWENNLSSSGDYNQVIQAFLLSTEYRQRFGSP